MAASEPQLSADGGIRVGGVRSADEARLVAAGVGLSELLLRQCADPQQQVELVAEVRDVFRTFVDHGVLFTIATDGPEMMRTHLRDEFDLLLRIGALTQEELEEANARGYEASFVGGAHTASPNTPVGR